MSAYKKRPISSLDEALRYARPVKDVPAPSRRGAGKLGALIARMARHPGKAWVVFDMVKSEPKAKQRANSLRARLQDAHVHAAQRTERVGGVLHLRIYASVNPSSAPGE